MTRLSRPYAFTAHLIAVVGLTLLTQLGGLAWLVALFFRRRLIVFILAYAGLSAVAVTLAPSLGRVALPCFSEGPLRAQSPIYCLLNRHYVTPATKEVALDLAGRMEAAFPGTATLYLDANFPFADGFPLLPHLSHSDGRKLDLAFYYQRAGEYLPGATRSPIGYFAFEQGPTDCPDRLATLRWDLDWLQPLMADLSLDEERMRAVLTNLASDPRVSRIFVEPHLQEALDVSDAKIRFQGCRAARHDDHIHFETQVR